MMTAKKALELLNDMEFSEKYQGVQEYAEMLLLCKEALVLVKQQQEEIERLNKRVSEQKHALFEQQAYTAKLQDTLETKCDDCNNIRLTRPEYWKAIKQAKAEAYKEFADKVRQVIVLNNTHDGYLVHDIDYNCLMEDIDDVLKELVGDSK